MKDEELTITFYKIHKCGYYLGKEKKFGDIADTLSQLSQWARKLKFTDTAIIPTGEKSGTVSELRTTYFYDLKKGTTGNYLLVLWNELPDVEGEVATLSKSKKVGDDTKCMLTSLPGNSVPGTASYFWFLPNLGYYATVCRKGRTANNAAMIAYIKKFIEAYSSYCVCDKSSNNTVKIIGYKEFPTSQMLEVIPNFQVSRAEDKEEIQFISENVTKIRKIVRKETIKNELDIRLSLAQKMLVMMGIKKPVLTDENRKVKYELTYSPSKAELNQLIHNWKDGNESNYDDTGFYFSGDDENRIHWLSGSISRVQKTFPISYYDDEVIDIENLLKIIDSNQSELIKVLKIK